MWPYLVMLLISVSFIYISEIINDKVTGKLKIFFSYIFSFLGILTPAIMAGLRNFKVGIDINVYGNSVFLTSVYSNNLHSFFNDNPYFLSHYEKGYLILNFLISRITSNVHLFYFLLNLIFVSIVYIAIKLLKGNIDITFSWLLFLITTWLFSLNILRQGLALAFSFLCISLLLKDKKYLSCIFGVIAWTFHDSTLILLLILPVIYLLRKGEKLTNNQKLLILILPFPMVLLLNNIINYASTIPKFARHLISHSGDRFAWSLFLGFIIFLLPFIYSFIKDKRLLDSKYVSIFTIFLVIGAIFGGMGGYNYVIFGRMAYYFQFTIFIGVPIIYHELRKEKYVYPRRFTLELLGIKLSIIIIAIINFYFIFYIGNYGNLFPYLIN